VSGVPRCFPDSTIVCLGGGASLTPADVEYCRGKAVVIAIKDAIELAPWAEVFYCGDEVWWRHYGPTLTCAGLRFTVNATANQWATVLGISGSDGLELTDPECLRSGGHSGHQAINLAVHLGAKRIVLLGYDMRPTNGRDNWYATRLYAKKPAPYHHHHDRLLSVVEPLRQAGIAILNASRETSLTCFPRGDLQQALA
jgi:hypothetical protein